MPGNSKGDIAFTFDTSEFKKSVSQIVGEMGKISKNTTDMAKKTEKGMGGALTAFASKAMVALGAVLGAVKAIQANIPEIGTTFQIAGQIISKNLLWPLRKELIPILQKVLNWVRDNRVLFLQLGGVIANAFKLAVGAAQSFIRILQPVIDVVKGILKGIFGDTAQSVADTINLVMVKIAAFMILIETVLKPVFEGIAKYIVGLVSAMKAYWSGVIDGFRKVFDSKAFSGFGEDIKELLSTIGGLLTNLTPAFKAFGEVIGSVVAVAFTNLVSILRTAVNLLTLLFKMMADPKKIQAAWDEFTAKEAKIGSNLANTFGNAVTNVKGAVGAAPLKVNDAIITKDGKVVQTSPQDTIIATKNPGGGKSVSVSISFGDMHVTTTEGDAARAGENMIKGVERQIKNIILDTLVAEGAV